MASTTSADRRKPSGKAAQRTSGPEKSGSGTRRRTAGTPRKREAAQNVHLHTAHASIPVPYVTKGDLSANVRAAGAVLPDIRPPSPERAAFYAGLGALAVLGAVEWPVAAAIGAATVVAHRGRHEAS